MRVTEDDFNRLVTQVAVYDPKWYFEDYNEGVTDHVVHRVYPFRYINELDSSYSSVLFAREFLERQDIAYTVVYDAGDMNWCILSDYAPPHWVEAVERSKAWNDQLTLQNLQPRELDKPFAPALGWNQQPSE